MNPNFKETIKIISELLNKNHIKWALIGSTNMQLQGMSVVPLSLCIIVQLSDLNKIPKIFSQYLPSEVKELPPMTDEPGWEVKLKINNTEIQILGERNTGEYVSKLLANKLINLKFEDIDIPCFTLEAEAQAYAETNRKRKSKMVLDFLKNKKFNFILLNFILILLSVFSFDCCFY